MKQRPVKGIIVPLVTPLTDNGQLDIEHLYRLIDHIIGTGINGIFILGTTGEGSVLRNSLCQQVIETTCRYTNQRTMILVGIANTTLSQAIALAEIAADNGADGIVLSSPVFPISPGELFEYTKAFVQSCLLPVCLYNKPDQPEIAFTIETIKRLLSLENIILIKDSSGDRDYFKELIGLKEIRSDLSILMGLEQFLAEAVSQGADGGVTGGANLFPALYVDLYNAAIQGNDSEVQRLQKIVEAVVECIYQPNYLAGLKYALSCKKLCNPNQADSLFVVSPEQKKRIEQFLENFDDSCV